MGLWLHAVSASVRRAHCSHSPLHSNFLLVGSFSPGRARGRMSSSSQRTLPLAMEAYYEYPFEQKVSPSAERNKEPILQEVRNLVEGWEHLKEISVLEVASGTGQHVAFLAEALPKVKFSPTEIEGDLLGSIHAWTVDMPNVERPFKLDCGAEWQIKGMFQMILVANLTHIAPWSVTLGLFRGAQQQLHKGGILFVYGPFLKNGVETTQSNAQFNINLKEKNPEWGYRDIADMDTTSMDYGLRMVDTIDMPANNFTLLFKKT